MGAHECVFALVSTLGMFCSSCLSELFVLSRWLLSEQFLPIGRYPDCLPAHSFTARSLTVPDCTLCLHLLLLSFLYVSPNNPNCSWYHNLSLLKWFGDQGLAVGSFQLITAMCCWFHRAIKAVWLPLDLLCESKVVSATEARRGTNRKQGSFDHILRGNLWFRVSLHSHFPLLHLSLCSLQNTRYIA